MHQTMPEVTVSQDGPFPLYRMIFATWYDWNNVTCTVGGVTYQGLSWADSRCYQVNMARSVDFGLSWETIPHVFPTVSDPALLPERVFNGVATERFLGDYHAVTGDILHSAHVAINCNGVDDCDRDGDGFRDVDDPEPDVPAGAPLRLPDGPRWP